jgi:hypothetical protein
MTAVLPTTTITTAGTVTGATFQNSPQGSFCVFANFVYGSGGTTAKAFFQTSLDGGATWIDVTAHAFLLASKKSLFTLSALTARTTVLTAFTDGALADDTAIDGVHGQLWRVKLITTGTYATSTTIRVDVNGAGWN